MPCEYLTRPSDVQDADELESSQLAWPAGDDASLSSSLLDLSAPLAAAPFDVDQPPAPEPPVQGAAHDAIAGESPVMDILNVPMPELNSIDANLKGTEHTLVDLVRALEQYPKCLLRDDFYSPFLHCNLYEEDVPDMTTLAKTSMAVCCGSAMETADGARFARRAMDVERQRLIESYPAYSCMQQWDALHAMLVYAILELRVSSVRKDDWKQKPY